MPLHDFNDDTSYQQLCIQVDKYIADTADRYIRDRKISQSDIQNAWDELVPKLRSRRDPNYNLPGSPIAYAFEYLPRKITAKVGVLNYHYRGKGRLPKKVLDIGSGTNAVAIALGFSVIGDSVEVLASEPSDSMRDFTSFESKFPNITVKSISKRIEDFIDEYRAGLYTAEYEYYRYFDTITISSALAYYFSGRGASWWQDFSNALLNLATDNATLIIIEPHTKKYPLLNMLEPACQLAGWLLEGGQGKLLNEMLPNVTCKELRLEHLTDLQKRYIDKKYAVTSWNLNPRYREYILIFQR